jgi:tryptophan 2,3-dioxygenase
MDDRKKVDDRPLTPLSDEQRELRADGTGGIPQMRLAGTNPFTAYLNADVLHSLQVYRTKAPAEPSFFITSQVQDLLFKLAFTEARRARDELDLDEIDNALWILRRLKRVKSVNVATWEVLSSFSPLDFAEFRDALGEGSGFQSFMYRQLEFILGYKRAAMTKMHRGDPEVHAELKRVLSERSLYDSALAVLHRHGLPVPAEYLDRAWTEPYEASEDVVEAWRQVYASPARHPGLFDLAELLVDIAYDFGRWRMAHVLTVERLIGAKAGSGGSNGVDFLHRVAEHRFFPELWHVRSSI